MTLDGVFITVGIRKSLERVSGVIRADVRGEGAGVPWRGSPVWVLRTNMDECAEMIARS